MEDYQGEYYIVHESQGQVFRKWFLRVSALTLLLIIIGGVFYWFFQPKIDIELSQETISEGGLLTVKANSWFADNLVWEIGDTLIRDKEEISIEISDKLLDGKPYLFVVLKATGNGGEEFMVSKSLRIVNAGQEFSENKLLPIPSLKEVETLSGKNESKLLVDEENLDESLYTEEVMEDELIEYTDSPQEEVFTEIEGNQPIETQEVKPEVENAIDEEDKVKLIAEALLAGKKTENASNEEKVETHVTKAVEKKQYTWPNLNGWTLAEKANLLSDLHYSVEDREGLFYQIIEEFDVLDAHIHVMGKSGKVAKEYRPAPYLRLLLDGRNVAIRIRKADYNDKGLITLWQVGEVRR